MINYHIFIFRRDLRVNDNLALTTLFNTIIKTNENNVILPIFIFNSKQINKNTNKYFNKNSIEFLIQSLESLNTQLNNKLVYIHTEQDDIDVLEKLKNKIETRRPFGKLSSISFNIDYTPFAIKRDEQIKLWCKDNDILFITEQDYTLLPINTVLTNSGTFFSVFTPFYKKFLTLSSSIPQVFDINHKQLSELLYKTPPIIENTIKTKSSIRKYYFNDPNKNLFVIGGRDNAMNIIKKIREGEFKSYDNERDFPSLKDKTTKLSAYLKFGCVSIREVYYALLDTYGINHGLIRELIWREFYACIVFNKPRVLNGQITNKNVNLPFKEKYDNVKWSSNNEWFERWCKGQTGFPIVDAAMRQMNITGWMHNRCRMIVASFLVKDMLMDWTLGEQYFAQQLVDYDPASNNGGWQFSSSTGVDAQPYFRIFNPFSQSLKFDIDCEYIKKWVPELEDIDNKSIHTWDVSYEKHKNNTNYPKPMLVHKEQSKKAIELFRQY
jgi:deoxyribodipyrimidine photo-lyase